MYRFERAPVFFCTARLQDSKSDLIVRHLGLFRDSVRVARQHYHFTIDAAVVLPDRALMIWTLPQGDTDFAKRWQIIKEAFALHVPSPRYQSRAAIARGKRGIWQRKYWECRISTQADYDAALEIIRMAPVHDGLVHRPQDWPYGSFAQAAMTGGMARKAG